MQPVVRSDAKVRRLALCLAMAALASSNPRAQTACSVAATSARDPNATIESVRASNHGVALELRLLRLPSTVWAPAVVDMRSMRLMQAQRGRYGSPTFSLGELAGLRASDRLLVSAGMTESLVVPVPVGLLRIDDNVVNPANTSSKILDGLLCFRSDRSVSLLSETTSAGRRIPKDWQAASKDCQHAVQAGPMLLDDARPLVKTRGSLSTRRVFAAVDLNGEFVVGFSPQATAYDLACVLSAPALRLRSALALQGSELGGVLAVAPGAQLAFQWGSDDATVASALEIVRRPAAPRSVRPMRARPGP